MILHGKKSVFVDQPDGKLPFNWGNGLKRRLELKIDACG